MRIISGTAKGRTIITPTGLHTRPALAKVREAIFSSLGDIKYKVILDIYAGCGSLGLEALSRGAQKSYFIDGDSAAIKAIITNLKTLGFENQSRVFKRWLPHSLKNIVFDPRPDIIFCDPPYDKNLVNQTLKALLTYKLVDPHSLLIVEHSPRELVQVNGLGAVKQSKYGQTLITYLKKEAS